MKNQIAEDLIQKYLAGKCTEEEKALLFSWYNDRSNALPDSLEETDYEALHQKISSGLPSAKKPVRLWPKIAAAASILLVAAAGLVYLNSDKVPSKMASVVLNDLPPGGNTATLILANGTKISLTNARQGELIRQAGIEVYKNAENQLVYKSTGVPFSGQSSKNYHTVETPRGGQHQVILPDGTVVFLNAASSLRFPAVFSEQERSVELTGEAFFHVAKVNYKNRSIPFNVKAGNTNIAVLGTQFNVMAYPNEGGQETTLLEGSVQISRISQSGRTNENNTQPKILKPGEQARVSNSEPEIEIVKNLNTDAIMGWKSGVFLFDSTPIEKVMQQVSRWYNAEVVYIGNVPKVSFNGVIPRSSYASELLRILEAAGSVKFTIEGNKITVQNKPKR
jgi:transmembrane sensor